MTHLILLALLSAAPPQAADAADDLIERLATCQASWRDWKDDPVQSKHAAEIFNATFGNQASDGSFTPKQKVTVVGLPVLQVYPESVGMGVGFSVVLEATFEDARAHAEKALGKTLSQCENGDGMRTCGLEIAKERTVTLMAGERDTKKRALLGCYYFYAK
jgi:hypothetical protein